MMYRQLADVYEKLEATTKKLEKRDILSELYKKCSSEELAKVVLLSMGVVYPRGELELGIANEMMKKVIQNIYGIDKHELEKKFKETGDLGLTAEFFIRHKKQQTLMKRDLTIEKVFENLRKLPKITGVGSQERKIALISELLSCAKEKEARYLVRTVLGEMRIGVAAGIVRDAIAKAFNKEPKDVEHVFNILGDYGKVAEMAKKGKMKAEIIPGSPLRVMLAERAPDLKTALEKFENPAIEMKYDGLRVVIHKQGSSVKLFSRRLDEITKQFPEVVEWSRKLIKADEAIVEGELLSVDSQGRPRPFQLLSRRIQRKYGIERMVREIPVQMNLFDLVYFNKENYMRKPLKERWKKLNEIITEKKGKFQLAEHIETKDFKKANKFYHYCLSKGEEGVMVKNLDAHYQPGKRVGYWLKCKPIMEPLDLVIIGAEWGEGKRAKWLGSLILGARDSETGKFLPTGMLGSGLTEEQLKEITKKLKNLIIEEKGRVVRIKPEIVVEVGYEEIQQSPKYPSGYALRFPRLLRFRENEKNPEDADTVQTIKKLFNMQRGRK
ncbi:MAG: ATP-dependent DNA ligase [Candidatus Aenigmarchaeota archaeon]|nr:ATP-dependent DNA ligase [Candidatus Aenigmarchaeota archaeon]